MLVWRHEFSWRKLIGKLWSLHVHLRRGGSRGQRRRDTVADRETYRANGLLRTVTDCWFPSARPLRAFSLFRRHWSKQLRTKTWPVPAESNLDRSRTMKRTPIVQASVRALYLQLSRLNIGTTCSR